MTQEILGEVLDFVLTNDSWKFAEVSANMGSHPRAKVGLVTWLAGLDGSLNYVGLSHAWEIDDFYIVPTFVGVAEWDESQSPVPESSVGYVSEFMPPVEPPERDAWEEFYVPPEEVETRKAIEVAMSVQQGTTDEADVLWLQDFVRVNCKDFIIREVSKEFVSKLELLANGDEQKFETDLDKIAELKFTHEDMMRWFGDKLPETSEYGKFMPTEQVLYDGEFMDEEGLKTIKDGELVKIFNEHVSTRRFGKTLKTELDVDAITKDAAWIAMEKRAGSSPLLRMVADSSFGIFPKRVREAAYVEYYDRLDTQREQPPQVDDPAYDKAFAGVVEWQVSRLEGLRASLAVVATGQQIMIGANDRKPREISQQIEESSDMLR
ncbi:hypothetical protein B7Z17_01640 [Candidatus Saccharibacteria bacterium 32-49-10]|nr:MAG: hypothetical protein B7Z17_01640 [Candidatus Saccharibacteria bacterium 32-49-10]